MTITMQELESETKKQTRIRDAAMLREMAGHRDCHCQGEHEYNCPRGALLAGARALALMAED